MLNSSCHIGLSQAGILMGLGHPKNDFELFETMFKSLRDVCVCVYVCMLGVGVKLFVLRIYSFYRSKLKPS